VETLDLLLAADASLVAVIDWDLPACEGPELCRLVRAYRRAAPLYIILLARHGHRLAEGLEAGADDCVRTPAGADELRARLNVGRRFAALPWERVIQAATGGSRGAPDHVLHAVPELEAVRSLDADELDDAGSAARFALKSVLVAG
jgi:DNA-binding response OmpR family regulator